MKNKGLLIAGAAALGVVPTVAGSLMGDGLHVEGFAAPLIWFGRGLRAMSLSGFWGNFLSWTVTLVLCALPLVFLAWRRRGGRAKMGEDWLLALMVPQIFVLVYYLVNPAQLARDGIAGGAVLPMFLLAVGGSLLATLSAWASLALLRGLENAPLAKLSKAFRWLLTGCGTLLAFGAVNGQLATLAARWTSVTEGNTVLTGSVQITLGMLVLLAVLRLIPDLLTALTLLWGADLARTLGRGVFDREAVDLCGRTAAGCREVARATVALAVLSNLFQLLLFRYLHSGEYSAVFPLFTLMLSAGLYLLCRCLQRGRELQEDSDSII